MQHSLGIKWIYIYIFLHALWQDDWNPSEMWRMTLFAAWLQPLNSRVCISRSAQEKANKKICIIKASTQVKVGLFLHMCAAKTNKKVTRNSKRQTGGCLLRLGAHKLCAGQRLGGVARCKKCPVWRQKTKSSSLSFLAVELIFYESRQPERNAIHNWFFGALCFLPHACKVLILNPARVRLIFLAVRAKRGDSSRLGVCAFIPPTWVCGHKRCSSERKPAVTRARYKYFIPGEIGSQINSTRGHINDGVVKIFDSPKGDC